MILALAVLVSCYAIDGDTLKCNGQNIRLLGIDAPELPGHCRKGRHCAPGNPYESKRSLSDGLFSAPVRIIPVTRDRYGRTVATVTAGRQDLSCWQLRRRQAIYKPQWDNGGIIRRKCPAVAR